MSSPIGPSTRAEAPAPAAAAGPEGRTDPAGAARASGTSSPFAQLSEGLASRGLFRGDRHTSCRCSALAMLASPGLAGGGPGVFALASRPYEAVRGHGGLPQARQGHAGAFVGAETATEDPALLLHSAARHLAQLAPPGMPGSTVDSSLQPTLRLGHGLPDVLAGATASPTSVEDLMPGLVRRIAWSGDAHQGALRLEVGSGTHTGATVVIQSRGGRVYVTLAAPPGDSPATAASRSELEAWRDRIAARLEARGLHVATVDVA